MEQSETRMKKASTLKEMSDSFDPYPLETWEEMERFYVETMEARVGDPMESPIQEIELACQEPKGRNAMLLLGHRGCGKSTELNRMKLRLEEKGHPVVLIQCEDRLPLTNNPRFSDLLILMGEELYDLSVRLEIPVRTEILETIQNFWTPVVQVREQGKEENVELGAGVKIAPPDLLRFVASLFVQLNSDVKYNDNFREKSEKHIENHYADWKTVIDSLSDGISKKAGKQPILIFEGLDHLEDLAESRNLFFSHTGKLTDVSFPVIYTFPIALYYDKEFSTHENEFREVAIFPMMKLETIDGEPYPKSWDNLREIVKKRTEDGLIEPLALEKMIEKTGGSLRDLFQVIRRAAARAAYREELEGKPQKLNVEDAQRALIRLQGSLTRRIEGKEHEFLLKVCKGTRQGIEDKQMLLDMLQARTLLEYNGERWFNVHPVVRDYLEKLEKQGYFA